jgi:hypothetical protein
MMRMDPDTGEIDCLIPVEDFRVVLTEGEGAWRVASAHELFVVESSVPFDFSTESFDVGCEFDGVGFNSTLSPAGLHLPTH